MKVVVDSMFPAPQEYVWELLQQSATLEYVTAGLVRFASGTLPERWEVGVPIHTHVGLFQSVPKQPYIITFEKIDSRQFEMVTREKSDGVVTRWDHTMCVLPVTDGACIYIDEIEVEAGRFTFFVAFLVRLYYKRRHVRWLKLLEEIKET